MKVSCNDIEGLRGAVADGHIILYVPETLVTALLDELMALRKVADEASKLVDPNADDPSWERTRDALREAGR